MGVAAIRPADDSAVGSGLVGERDRAGKELALQYRIERLREGIVGTVHRREECCRWS